MDHRPLWKSLMINGPIVMFWRSSMLEKYVDDIEGEGFDVYHFDCELWDGNRALVELGKTLEFPDYYGKNLDAFNDCLSDTVPSNEGMVLIFKNFDNFNERDRETAYYILDIVANNSWQLLVEHQKKLMVFVHTNDSNLQIQPVGAWPVIWNNGEWLKKSRGL